MTQALSVSNVISPVLMAIQAEQARRIVVKDTADKVPYHDARSAGSIGSGRDAAATGQVPPHLSPIDFALSSGSGERILTGGGSDPPLYAPELPLPTTSLIRARHAEAAGLSVTTAPAATATAISTQSLHSAKIGGVVIPVRSEPDETIYGRYGLHRHKILDNKRQVLAQDTRGRVSLWDILLCCRVYEFPEFERAQDEAIKSDVPYANIFGTDFDAIHAALSGEPESVSSWCHVDTRVGVLTVHLDESWVWDAEVHIDEVDRVPDSAIAAMGDHERVNIGQWMLKRLFKAYTRHRMRRGPLSRHDAAQLNRWTLCEEERAALADISAWQEFGQQRNTNSEGALPGSAADRPTEYAGRPELYLNLFCKGKRVLPKYTLATIKATAWKASSDIQVNYDWAEFVKRRVSKSQALVASSNALLPTSPATVSVSAGAGAATTT
ncbi:hypothetical protein GGI02_002396 [Coemansia sp. RSA 2322]|nr:hypothetical protein GGI02_002396 [Coemansia sp. RSA 2322]